MCLVDTTVNCKNMNAKYLSVQFIFIIGSGIGLLLTGGKTSHNVMNDYYLGFTHTNTLADHSFFTHYKYCRIDHCVVDDVSGTGWS